MVSIQAARKIRGGFEPGAEYTDLDLFKVSPTVRNHGIQAGEGGRQSVLSAVAHGRRQ